MRWHALLVHWRRWFTGPIRLYRECRLERIRLVGGPQDGAPFTVSLATLEVGILHYAPPPGDGITVEGHYHRAGPGRFQWEEHR
jgi:hypothetical protein